MVSLSETKPVPADSDYDSCASIGVYLFLQVELKEMQTISFDDDPYIGLIIKKYIKLTLMKGETIEKKKFVLEDELIIRESCGS
ncbi:hypothetical protein [Peribacillus sp. NPDC058002]|uniref:hypothetical protein n=1 Tax=Peribacillus sp. NPDC058002 TaxID=3346301 RepID=UPI0036DD3385